MDNKLTSKQKIDQLLGIQDDQSIDSFLDDLSQQTDEISSVFSNIDDKVKDNLQVIDANLTAVQTGKIDSILALKNMDLSMKEVEELISVSKKLFIHIYENIITSDLLDSELIAAAAKMLESVHINIAEFLQMYRDRQQFIEKIKIMVFQQEQKKELMLLKHKLDLEKLDKKGDANTIDVENLMAYSIEDITRLMHEKEIEE